MECSTGASAEAPGIVTREAILQERADGRYESALHLARGRLATLEADSTTKEDDLVDARWDAALLEAATHFDASQKRLLQDADSLANIASDDLGDAYFGAAVEARRRRVEITGRLFGEDHPETADGLEKWAALLFNHGRCQEATSLFRRARAAFVTSLGERSIRVTSLDAGLAGSLACQGQYDEAEARYRHSLAGTMAEHGEMDTYVALGYSNLAAILTKEGNYEGAEVELRRALRISTELSGNAHPVFEGNLSTVLLCMGRLPEAKEHAEKSVRQFVEGKYSDRWIARALQQLAEIELAAGQIVTADSIAALASERWSRVGVAHPDLGRTLGLRAEIDLRRGDLAGAERLALQASQILRASTAGRGADQCRVLLALGESYRRQARGEEAEAVLQESSRIYELARARVFPSPTRATLRLASPYPELARVRLDRRADEEAWAAWELGTGRCLSELVAQAAHRNRTPRERDTEDSLCAALDDLGRELDAAGTEPDGQAREQRTDRIREQLLATEARWLELRRALASREGALAVQTASLEEVQRALAPDEAMVGWIDAARGAPCYAFLLRSRGTVEWMRCPASESASVEATDPEGTTAFRAELARAGAFRSRVPMDPEIRALAAEVGAGRLDPILDRLAGIRRIIVIPSDAMLGIPVEALLLRDGDWAGDRFEVSYAPSATLFLQTRTRSRSDRVVGTASLLVADPALDGADRSRDERSAWMNSTRTSAQGAAALNRSWAPTRSSQERASLPGARREVAQIAETLTDPEIILGSAASERTLERMSRDGVLATYRVLHFATHAQIDDRAPYRSALVLSASDPSTEPVDPSTGLRYFDGLITAEEIARDWTLNAELVVLSSCQSAVGRQAPGEGYLGMAHALTQAGALSVLASLWKMDDTAAELLMVRFYENWTGVRRAANPGPRPAPMSKAAALREARMWLRHWRDAEGRTPFAHPAYWAGFVLLGEPD